MIIPMIIMDIILNTLYNLQLTTYNLQLTTYNLQLTTQLKIYTLYLMSFLSALHQFFYFDDKRYSLLYKLII